MKSLTWLQDISTPNFNSGLSNHELFNFEDRWSIALRHHHFLHSKVQVQIPVAAKTHNHDFYYIFSSDECQAKLGHLNFWAETELTICMSIWSKFSKTAIKFPNFTKMIIQKMKSTFRLVFERFSVLSWMKEGHEPSRAENLSASSAWTYH